LYAAFTEYTGFKVDSGDQKVIGLAPYGEPKFVEAIHLKLVDLRERLVHVEQAVFQLFE
jgi:carbamoyltransferase